MLLNLINHQPDIDKTYLWGNDPYEGKYNFLIKKHRRLGLKHCNDAKVFIEYSSDMCNIYKNIDEYIWLLIWIVTKNLTQSN